MTIRAIQGRIESEPHNENYSYLDSENELRKQDIGDLETRADDIESDIADLNTDLSNLGTELNNAIDNLENEVNDLIEEKTDRIYETVTVTVGGSGDFSTIDAAIEHLSRRYPEHKVGTPFVEAIIQLNSDYVMAEQVFVRNVNLGWIRITTGQSVVTIDRSALTRQVDVDIDPEFSIRPAFACFEGTLPKIDVQFEMNTSGSGDLFSGIFLDNSKCVILPDGGIRNATFIGCCAINGSVVVANHTDFSGSGNRSELTASNWEGLSYGDGFRIWNSTLSAAYSNVDNTGDMGFNISQGSKGLVNSAHGNNCGHHGLLVTTGSICGARNAEFKDGIDDNVVVYAGGSLDFRNGDCSNAETGCGLVVTRASHCNFENGIANNCGNGGIYANRGSIIDAYGATANYGGDDNVTAGNNSLINFVYGEAIESDNDNLHCTHGSVIAAHQSTLTGAGRNGALAYSAQIFAHESDLSGATEDGVEATRGSYVSVYGSNLSNAGERGVHAQYSIVQAGEITATNVGHRGIEATRGSAVYAYGSDTSGAADNGFCIYNGSTIVAVGASGTSNRTENELTSNGYILR